MISANFLTGKSMKIDKNNRCKQDNCEGFLYCTYNGFLWIERCTNCGHEEKHHNRRKEQKDIEFEDRRTT